MSIARVPQAGPISEYQGRGRVKIRPLERLPKHGFVAHLNTAAREADRASSLVIL